MWCQQLDELVVGKATGLGQAAHAAANIDKGVPVVDEREEIVQSIMASGISQMGICMYS